MKTLIVFGALASASACAQAAGLFDNATAVQNVSEAPAASATASAPQPQAEAPKAAPAVLGSVQYSVGGKTLAAGSLPLHSRLVKLPDGRVVRMFVNPAPEAPAAPQGAVPVTLSASAGQPQAPAPEPTPAPEVQGSAQAFELRLPQAVSPPSSPAPAAVAVEAPAPIPVASPAPAPVAQTPAAAVPPPAPAVPGYAVFVMPDGRVLRVDTAKPASTPRTANAGGKPLEWTLEVPGEPPMQITPEMVSAEKITLPDGRVLKIVSAPELAAEKARREKQSLFSQAQSVESRLAQGGENREIPVTYVNGEQSVSLREKVDAAMPVSPTNPANP